MAMISMVNTVCSHCGRDNAVLEAVGEVNQPLKKTNALSFICRSCSGIMVAEVELGPNYRIYSRLLDYCSSYATDINLEGRSGYSNSWGAVRRIYPAAIKHKAPTATPERASKFFIEAKENFERGNYETAVGLARKVIDLTTHSLGVAADISVNNLSARINRLRDNNLLTPDMAAWAHFVRLDGNESVHTDEEFTEKEAKEVLDFTETFLLYAFTLPSMVVSRRSDETPSA